ncbi:MAG: phosphoadenosine phosphosulfate reductase family protein [Pontiella sp.]|nr:phosphoadenosine phosphosulfate reductase family protein [Pontiella sp.]
MNDKIHVVGLSGGKDLTALALRLAEIEPRDYVYLCTPTGDELPEMLQHWGKLEHVLGKKLLMLSPGFDLNELCDRESMLPNWRARFCTRSLKIEPCQQWINEQPGEVVLYIGLRADEEGREGGIYENCRVEFPFREWGWNIETVLDYLKGRGIKIPERTDCARCFFQTLPEWWRLWREYPEIYADAEAQEARFGHTFRSPGRDTWPASLAGLREAFENGRIPRNTNLQPDLFGFSANKCRVCSL